MYAVLDCPQQSENQMVFKHIVNLKERKKNQSYRHICDKSDRNTKKMPKCHQKNLVDRLINDLILPVLWLVFNSAELLLLSHLEMFFIIQNLFQEDVQLTHFIKTNLENK